MAYTTDNDVQLAVGGRERLIELTDLEETGEIDTLALAAARTAAESWIDGFLRQRYATPIPAPLPPELVQLAAEEIKYRLQDRRGMVTDDARKSHEERERHLKALAKGEVRFGVEPGLAKSSSVKATYVDRSEDEDVSRESLKGTVC